MGTHMTCLFGNVDALPSQAILDQYGNQVINKNFLFGGQKIPKEKLCVNEIFYTISGNGVRYLEMGSGIIK
jgi:hypothetical protein